MPSEMVAEILDGELFTFARPARPHTRSASRLTMKLGAPFDLGDGEIDFPACHRVLKSVAYKGWLCVDLDTARNGPRASYERCGQYVVDKLESIYV